MLSHVLCCFHFSILLPSVPSNNNVYFTCGCCCLLVLVACLLKAWKWDGINWRKEVVELSFGSWTGAKWAFYSKQSSFLWSRREREFSWRRSGCLYCYWTGTLELWMELDGVKTCVFSEKCMQQSHHHHIQCQPAHKNAHKKDHHHHHHLWRKKVKRKVATLRTCASAGQTEYIRVSVTHLLHMDHP
jgi:hypothetical protein